MTGASGPPTEGDRPEGLTIRRAWSVWSNQTEHRVDVEYNQLTGVLRTFVDGEQRDRRRAWRMDVGGVEVAFEVDGRPCLLVARGRYGGAPDIDLYSDGRSLSTGAELGERRADAARDVPNIVRMLILFVPLIGLTSLLRPNGARGVVLEAWAVSALIVVGLAIAGGAWWLASRWYGKAPTGAMRHVVGAGIALAGYVALIAAYVILLQASR